MLLIGVHTQVCGQSDLSDVTMTVGCWCSAAGMVMLIHDHTSASLSRLCAPYIASLPRCRRPLPPHCNTTISLTWTVTRSPPRPTRIQWAYCSDWSSPNCDCVVLLCQRLWHSSGICHLRHDGYVVRQLVCWEQDYSRNYWWIFVKFLDGLALGQEDPFDFDGNLDAGIRSHLV